MGYIGRLVNGIINISRLAFFSFSLYVSLSFSLSLSRTCLSPHRLRDTLADNLCEIVKSSFTTSRPLGIFELSRHGDIFLA